jgi:hypothetical protein
MRIHKRKTQAMIWQNSTMQKNKPLTRGLMPALLLALLLHVSGHIFLHLGDDTLAGDETHLTSHQESRTASAPQHQCSVCQDHQHLSLESSSLAAITLAVNPTSPARQNEALPSFLPAHFKPTRAPPRG